MLSSENYVTRADDLTGLNVVTGCICGFYSHNNFCKLCQRFFAIFRGSRTPILTNRDRAIGLPVPPRRRAETKLRKGNGSSSGSRYSGGRRGPSRTGVKARPSV